MIFWPFKRKRKPKLIFRQTGVEIYAQDWRETPALVSTAMRITSDAGFMQMLECVRTESPANKSFADFDTTLVARACHQSKIEGWNQCIDTMLSLAKPLDTEPVIEEDYGVEEPETKG